MFTTHVNFSNRYHQLAAALIVAVCSSLLSSCVEKISTIGSDYVQDSVLHGTTTFSEATVLQLSPVAKPTLVVANRRYNINYGSPYLFFGNVASENLQVWAVLKIPFLVDTVGRVLDDSLVLKMKNTFLYSPGVNSEVVDFFVYVETGHKTADSAGSLSMSDLNPTPVAHFIGTPSKDSLLKVVIQLDTAIVFPLLRTTALALVIVPGPTMNSVRAFASIDNGTVTSSPFLQLKIASGTGSYQTVRYPDYDYHIVSVPPTLQQGMFELRGSASRRERIVINTKEIRTRLSLTPFSTINNALIQFTSDPAQHTTTTVPVDTILPYLTFRDSVADDSLKHYPVISSRLSSDPNVFSYQIQTDIEYAIRHGLDSIIFELQTGFGLRSLNSAVAVADDYNLNHWMFYSSDAADANKRPKLVITYSYLK